MTTLRNAMLLACFGWSVLPASSSWGVVVELDVEFVEGDGFVEADLGPGPHLVDVPVGEKHWVSLRFNRHVHRVLPRLGSSATMDAEFVVDNTSNSHDVSYNIKAGYSLLGNDVIGGLSITEGTVMAGELRMLNLPLQPLFSGDLTGLSFSVDTVFLGGGNEGTFDFYVVGGGGDPNQAAMGPIRWSPAHLVGPPLGDVDWNGEVNLLDLFYVQNNFGKPSPPYTGDSNGDGEISLQDLFDVQNGFGKPRADVSALLSAAVPEPSPLLLLVAGIGTLWSLQRYRFSERSHYSE